METPSSAEGIWRDVYTPQNSEYKRTPSNWKDISSPIPFNENDNNNNNNKTSSIMEFLNIYCIYNLFEL
jgi:hypothetical protein